MFSLWKYRLCRATWATIGAVGAVVLFAVILVLGVAALAGAVLFIQWLDLGAWAGWHWVEQVFKWFFLGALALVVILAMIGAGHDVLKFARKRGWCERYGEG